MPLDPNIYQHPQPNLASQLAGSLNQFTEQRARLSDLAQQREQQAITQGYQNRALQRAEDAVPAQQAELARAKAEKAQQQGSLEVANVLRSGRPREETEPIITQIYQKYGIPTDNLSQKLSGIYAQAPDQAANLLEEQAFPAEAAKQRMEQRFAAQKQSTPSQVNTLMRERAQMAEANPNDPNLRIMDRAIERAVTPQIVQVGGADGEAPIYATTAQAIGRQVPKKAGKDATLSPQAQKEVFEADENAQAAIGVMDTLRQAKQLNNQAYSGYGALIRAKTSSNLPGQTDPKADATIQLDNLIREQALSSLKLTFGGSPTEGERAMLLELQASTEKTPEQRAKIIDKAISMADRKLRFNQQKAESLRGGTYFKEAPKATQQTAQPEMSANAVTLPDGRVKQFSSAAAAQAFKKAAGLQ